ncbi:MAG: nuclear transport factor 2 family protein [Pseudomonadota bacterium]|nr:nuclear transport factor 2 family protein [Pseudomonadota bacterium]
MDSALIDRSPADVLDDHLRERKEGSVEQDLSRNYSDDLVVLTGGGVFRGHDGLRQLAERLRQELPDATFEYRTRLIEGEVGFLLWSARSANAYVDDGADSYVIRGGRIVAQTIHYTVKTTPSRTPQ